MEINLYVFSFLLTTTISIIFAIFIYFRARQTRAGQCLFEMCLAIAAWTASAAWLFALSDSHLSQLALWAARLCIACAVMIPVLLLRFYCAFLEIEVNNKKLIRFVWLWTVLNLSVAFTPWFVQSARSIVGFHYYPEAGPLFWSHFINFSVWVIYSHWLVIANYKKLNLIKQKQAKLLFAALIMGFAVGGTTFLPCFNIAYDPWPSHFTWIYVALMFYAIVRYQFLEVSFILRKAVVFTLLFAFVGGVFGLSALFVQEFLAREAAWNSRYVYAITIAMIVFLFKPLENFLTRITDRFLFQKKYDFQKVIRHFSNDVSHVISRSKLIEKTYELIQSTLKVEKVALIFNPKDMAMDYDNTLTCIPIKRTGAVIGQLVVGRKRSGDGLSEDDQNLLLTLAGQIAIALKNIELFEEATQAQAEAAQASKMATVGTLAASINHEVRNPLYVAKGALQSYILRMKRAQESPPQQRRRAGIDDSLRQDDDGGQAQTIGEKNKDVKDVSLRGGHKPNEAISKRDRHAPLRGSRDDNSASHNAGNIEEAVELMENSIKQIDRATSIMQSLSRLSKPSHQFEKEDVNLKEALEDVLILLKHEFKYNETQLEINIPKDLPTVRANKQHIEEILFNLLMNAYHATEDRPKSRVTITVQEVHRPQSAVHGQSTVDRGRNGKTTQIAISDNGAGIPKDKLDKIFEPFYTTKGEKGTGLGLYVTKKLVEANQGKLSVSSELGKGTTFSVVF